MSSLLGPSYDYWKSIKQPSEMGMSPGFSLGALATNVDGLLSYVEVLISGSGNASVTGKPLGNKFFLKTTGQCSETTAEKWKSERDEDERWEKEYEEVENKEPAKFPISLNPSRFAFGHLFPEAGLNPPGNQHGFISTISTSAI